MRSRRGFDYEDAQRVVIQDLMSCLLGLHFQKSYFVGRHPFGMVGGILCKGFGDEIKAITWEGIGNDDQPTMSSMFVEEVNS